MPSINMQGPFELTNESIDKNVKDSIHGNYLLGYLNEKGVFKVQYVGRADNGLVRRLKEHVSEGYACFWYSTCSSAKEAFDEECRNWHDFGGAKGQLDNIYHPDRPNEKHYKCPCCGVFDDE